jgi:hypothetical protein
MSTEQPPKYYVLHGLFWEIIPLYDENDKIINQFLTERVDGILERNIPSPFDLLEKFNTKNSLCIGQVLDPHCHLTQFAKCVSEYIVLRTKYTPMVQNLQIQRIELGCENDISMKIYICVVGNTYEYQIALLRDFKHGPVSVSHRFSWGQIQNGVRNDMFYRLVTTYSPRGRKNITQDLLNREETARFATDSKWEWDFADKNVSFDSFS